MAENNTKPTAEKISHKSVYAALSAFQGELEPIEQSASVKFKTKAGEEVNFTYAPLGKIMEVIYPLLAKHGLAVRHELTETSVEAILTHETAEEKETVVEINYQKVEGGEERERTSEKKQFVATNELRSGKLLIDAKKAEMKDVGAQITYARRYTLGMVLGLATEEDKDAQLLEQSVKNLGSFAFKQALANVEKAEGKKLDEQIEFLEKELKLAEELEAGTGKKAPSLGLKADQYREIITVAKARKGGKNAGAGEQA